jgi:hypothetical protein
MERTAEQPDGLQAIGHLPQLARAYPVTLK